MKEKTYVSIPAMIILLYSMVLSLVLLAGRMFGVIYIDWIWVIVIPVIAWIGIHVINIILSTLLAVFALFLEGR